MSGKLDQRLAALRDAADLAAGRLDDADVDAARTVVERAGARLGLGLESTVVALAGPTGVGKSQLFNVLTGTDLAAVGRRRPTTASGQAAIWGDGGDALLDWLEIGRRHRVGDDGLGGLVLLDLPDFDSIETSHRLEAERVVGLADLVLWVVEPQKYADASLHDRYLRPLATHAGAMGIVLNQADLLGTDDVEAWRNDMERLLERDGLSKLPLVVVSARSGDGIPALQRLLAERVAARDAAVAKLAADLQQAAEPLAASCEGGGRGVRAEDSRRLRQALEEAAGVPTVVRAVRAAHLRRGALATGWPPVRWLRRFRPDPLRRLRLSESPEPPTRTSMPPPTDVQRAQVASASRRLADGASEGLAQPWPRLVREAAVAADEQVADRLDRDLGRDRPTRLAAALVAGRGLAPERVRDSTGCRRSLACRPRPPRLAPDRGRRPAPRSCRDPDPDVAPPRRCSSRAGAGIRGAADERRWREQTSAEGRSLPPKPGRGGGTGACYGAGRAGARRPRAALRGG